MNIFSHFHERLLTFLKHHAQSQGWNELNLEKITFESPKDASHGDFATNAALVLSKQVGIKSVELAKHLTTALLADQSTDAPLPPHTQFDVAGPGFINITLPTSFWHDHVRTIVHAGESYGANPIGAGKTVHIEFVSANPTGPMHTGHSRNAVVGDSIASILEAVGYTVHREYYINDAGSQMDTLARSVYLRYTELLGATVEPEAFEGLYPGEYVIDMARVVQSEHGAIFLNQPESEWLSPIRDIAIREAMNSIKHDLKNLGVVMDTYTSEAELTRRGVIDEAVDFLRAKGDVYEGTLETPKGFDSTQDADIEQDRTQTLFRSKKYGDSMDRALKKSDGSWSYFAPDIAYHFDKFRRGFTDLIDVLGVDHVGYFSRIQAAVRAITSDQATLQICHYNIVNFLENGVPLKMSKRAGTFITLRDLLDKVGRDVVRFIMLTRHHNGVIDFDFAKVLEHTKDNPIFYVQYAHARICSVLRQAEKLWGDVTPDLNNSACDHLNDVSELDMIKILAAYPKTLEVAAQLREPHRLAYYLYDVAAHFHSLWNKGKDNTQLRFIDPQDKTASLSRLCLLRATQSILKSSLGVLKITPIDEMR